MGRSTVRAQYFALRFRPDTPHSAALPDEPSPGPNTFGAQRTVHSARAAVAANPSVSALFVHRLDARGSSSSLRRIVSATYRPFDVSSLRSAVPQGHCAERTARRKQYCVCTVLFRCGGATLVRLTRGGSNQRPRSRLVATPLLARSLAVNPGSCPKLRLREGALANQQRTSRLHSVFTMCSAQQIGL